MIDKLLKGAKPDELPFEQIKRRYFVVNLGSCVQVAALQRLRSFNLEAQMTDEGKERDVLGSFTPTEVYCQRQHASGMTRTLVWKTLEHQAKRPDPCGIGKWRTANKGA